MLKKLLIALDTKYSDRERKLELMIASFAPLDVFSSKKKKKTKRKKKTGLSRLPHMISI